MGATGPGFTPHPSSGRESGSRRPGHPSQLLRRPAAARLAEPLLWALSLGVAFSRLPPEEACRLAGYAAAYLVARIVADTGPNLAGAARLESAPYSEHWIRRALGRVKLGLALLVTLPVLPLAAAIGGASHASSGAPDLTTALWLLAALASHAVAAPILREHRGVSRARPSLGPAAAALAFLPFAAFATPGAERFAALAVIALIGCNVVVGGIQRYVAAAMKLNRPGSGFGHTDLAARAVDAAPLEIARHSLALTPFLLLPIAPALCDLVAQPEIDPRLALLAVTVAAIPPILFDAKRRARRFRIASYACAAALALAFLACLLLGADAEARPLLSTAVLLVAYPPLNALIGRGARRSVGALLLIHLLARALLARQWPELRWPLVEVALVVLAMAAALEYGEREGGGQPS
jgi:hypothetical protein